MGSLTINLLGTSFKINAQQDDRYLQELLDYYRDVIEKLKNSVPHQEPLQTAILAGIMISDELYTQKYSETGTIPPLQDQQLLSQVEDVAAKLINRIDQVL